MGLYLYLYLFLSTFLAYFVKAITGFGNTLVLGSLFSFATSNRLTTPVDLLFSFPTNAMIAWRERRSISFKAALPLMLLLLLGIVPGVFLLRTGNDWILKSVLGLVIVGLALEMLLRKPTAGQKQPNKVAMVLIGVLSGVLVGLYGIGALLVAYINRTTKDRGEFRGKTCFIFLAENVFRLFLYGFTGLLSGEVLLTALTLAPAVALGMFAGFQADKRLSEATVRYAIIAMLLVSGLSLFVKSAFFH